MIESAAISPPLFIARSLGACLKSAVTANRCEGIFLLRGIKSGELILGTKNTAIYSFENGLRMLSWKSCCEPD